MQNATYTFEVTTHVGPVQYSASTEVSHEELVKLGKEAFVSHLHRSGNSAAEAALRKAFKLGDKVGRDAIPFNDEARDVASEALIDPESYPKNSVFRNGAGIEVATLDEAWTPKDAAGIKFARARAILQGAAFGGETAIRALADKVGYEGVGELNEENENFLAAIHKMATATKP